MAKVSIIVPVYNAEKYLNQCLDSLVNQTLNDIEIIAINDGSTDNSLNILEKYNSIFGNKIKIIDQTNNGAGSARNKGLDVANGEFIKFVDADDYLDLTILERMIYITKDKNVKLVRGNYTTLIGPFKMSDANSWSGLKGSQIVDVRKNKDYIITETPGIGNKLIHRDLLDNTRFPEKTKWEDLAVMPVVVASSEKLFHMDESIYNYRIHMNSTISDFVKKTPKVLDIFKCVEQLNQNLIDRGLDEEYAKQMEGLYILHMLFRVENAIMWVNFSKDNKIVIINSIVNLIELKYPNWRNNEYIAKYRAINPLFDFDMKRLDTYLDDSLRNENDFSIISERVNETFKTR